MIDDRLHAYSSPFNVGHAALVNFWDGTIWISEKIDGSQFSFGLDSQGNLRARSRQQDLTPFTFDTSLGGMFKLALETVVALKPKLEPGWTYRAEFLSKPKHNTLAYNRVPKGNIILFDIDMGDQLYIDPYAAKGVAEEIGLEFVRIFGSIQGKVPLEQLLQYLKEESILGGPTIEGIVLKNYNQWGVDHKTLMAKLVAADFREKHDADWKLRNPKASSFMELLLEQYATEARWAKAVQHLQEQGKLIGAPQDIGLLIREIPEDVMKDYEEEIKDAVWAHFKKDFVRGLTRNMPEWYKRKLAEDFVK